MNGVWPKYRVVAEVPHEVREGSLNSVGLTLMQDPPARERPEGSSNTGHWLKG